MKKSLIAFALLAAASLAMALPSTPPPVHAGSFAAPQASAGVPQVSHGTAAVVAADVAQADAIKSQASAHPGAGERELHPTFNAVGTHGVREVASAASSKRAWPSGEAAAFQAVHVGSIPTARSTGST